MGFYLKLLVFDTSDGQLKHNKSENLIAGHEIIKQFLTSSKLILLNFWT